MQTGKCRHKQATTPVPASFDAFLLLSSFQLLAAESARLCFEPEHRECASKSNKLHVSTVKYLVSNTGFCCLALTYAHTSTCTQRRRETDLQVRGVDFLVAQSQISLQSLFGLVEVDTLSAPVLHLGSQLIPLLAQFLQSLLSSEQLGNMQ